MLTTLQIGVGSAHVQRHCERRSFARRAIQRNVPTTVDRIRASRIGDPIEDPLFPGVVSSMSRIDATDGNVQHRWRSQVGSVANPAIAIPIPVLTIR